MRFKVMKSESRPSVENDNRDTFSGTLIKKRGLSVFDVSFLMLP
jgi:hypothetical protein